MDSVMAAVRRFARTGQVRSRPQPYCQVCLAPSTQRRLVSNPNNGGKTAVLVCPRCGYVELPGDPANQPTGPPAASLEWAARRGTLDRTGDQFDMTRLGVELLGGSGLSVLVCGVGASADNVHIARLPAVRRVAALDTSITSDRFDIVVAAAMIERFSDPRREFATLCGYVDRGGVLICSAKAYGVGHQDRAGYAFGPGQVSAYPPDALRRIAQSNQMRLDFRTPRPVTGSRRDGDQYLVFARPGEVAAATQLNPRRVSGRSAGHAGRTPTGPA